MRTRVSAESIHEMETQLAIVYAFEGTDKLNGATAGVDAALGGHISELICSGDINGELGETTLLYPRGMIPAQRVLVVGLGAYERFGVGPLRRAIKKAARSLRGLRPTSFASVACPVGETGLTSERVAQTLVEGMILGLYEYVEYKTEDGLSTAQPVVEEIVLVDEDVTRLGESEVGARAGRAVGQAVHLTKDLVNRPASHATPSYLAAQAEEIAGQYGMHFGALGPAEMRDEGMGALLGVARGSHEEPRLIILDHDPHGRSAAPLVFVGKGITFDSGGLSLKSVAAIETMKADMAGGAAVLGAMSAIGALGLEQRVVAIVPATENMPGGRACHPGDIVRSVIGKTIEVLNTDGEGRLILADALGYARRFEPAAIVDVATMTGISRCALGHKGLAMFANDDALAERVVAASEATQERVWRFPLWEEFADLIRSDVADMQNCSGLGSGGPEGAMLLSQFTEGCAWAHLDFGAMGITKEVSDGVVVRTPSGWGTRLLIEIARQWTSAV